MLTLGDFGGVMMRIVTGCIGLHGGSFAIRKKREVWGFEISTLSIWLCLLSRLGVLSMTLSLCVPEFSNPNIIPMAIS
jgi:hypothetical protein